LRTARKRPVESITTSTPSSVQGKRAGSVSVGVAISTPPMSIAPSIASIRPVNGLWTLARFRSRASMAGSATSLTATHSMFASRS
jgi:hypothetical protein